MPSGRAVGGAEILRIPAILTWLVRLLFSSYNLRLFSKKVSQKY